MSVLACPRGLGAVWLFVVGFATRTVWRFPVGSQPDGGKGGFVLWCYAVAGLSWLGLSCLAILAPHLTVLLFQHTSLLFRPPYIITCTSRYIGLGHGRTERLISARISGSLGVLVEEAQPERRLGRSVPVCFRCLRFPTYLISKRSLRRPIFSFLCVMGAHQGAFMPRHSGSPSHSTLIPQHTSMLSGPPILLLVLPRYICLGHGRTESGPNGPCRTRPKDVVRRSPYMEPA